MTRRCVGERLTRAGAAAVPALTPAVVQMCVTVSGGPPAGPPALAATALGCAALLGRRTRPLAALAGTLAAVLAAALAAALAGAPADTVGPPVAVALALYALAVHGTAGTAVSGVAATALAAALAAALTGSPPRHTAGTAVVVAGCGAVLWAAGRSRRRRAADREAVRAHRAASGAAVRYEVLAERERFAAELHDAAAHRLTGVVVSCAAALRLDRPDLTRDALRHAAAAGRGTVAELDRLTAPDTRPGGITLADIDTLAARHGADHTRTLDTAPPATAHTAHRVVREALTNAQRYASGAPVRVAVTARDTGRLLVVTVTDGGGERSAPGLGGGLGIPGLRSAVGAAGGTLTAGPSGPGWTVRAELPLTAPLPTRRWPAWPGPAARDWALVGLATALSLGVALLATGAPDSFGGPASASAFVALSALHAAPLAVRRRAPERGLAAVLLALLLWLGCDLADWGGPPAGDVLLVHWWVELAFVRSAGERLDRGRGLAAVTAVAAVGGLALARGTGISGDRVAAWAVLSALLAVPALFVWAAGRRAARRRAVRRADADRRRELRARETGAAVRAQRERFAAGLRDTARRHAHAVAEAADAGDLAAARSEARAALTALRDLLVELRAGAGAVAGPGPGSAVGPGPGSVAVRAGVGGGGRAGSGVGGWVAVRAGVGGGGRMDGRAGAGGGARGAVRAGAWPGARGTA
ncbi:sensor histidine kinase [Streptomyces uncialis]|uniref:sensor histidine kinase n=1 Tax=Streptomyces uncialis TaxID=1048205 RepID=UPI003862F15D|nr:histidine kinase [Streptomyces uncialis]